VLRDLRSAATIGFSFLVAAAVVVVPAAGALGIWRYAHERQSAIVVAPDFTAPKQRSVEPFVEFKSGSTTLVNLRRLPSAIGEWAQHQSQADAIDALNKATADAACVMAFSGNEVLIGRELPAPAHLGNAQKLLVGAVALEVLGPDYRFVTEIRGNEIVDGVHRGDLVIVGGGDPVLFSDVAIELARGNGIIPTDVGLLIDQLAAAGLRWVEGDLIGDGRRFDNEFVVLDPEQPTARPPQISGLLINRGLLVGASYGLNPVQTAASEINRLLAARQIAVSGRSRSTIVEIPQASAALARVESAPLSELVVSMITADDDAAADMLLKAIGAEMTGLGTRASGIEAVQTTLAEWLDGMVDRAFVEGSGMGPDLVPLADLTDGAGRDSRNRLSCSALALAVSQLPPGIEPISVDVGLPGGSAGSDLSIYAGGTDELPLAVVVVGSDAEPSAVLEDLSRGVLELELLHPLGADLR